MIILAIYNEKYFSEQHFSYTVLVLTWRAAQEGSRFGCTNEGGHRARDTFSSEARDEICSLS